MKEVSKTIKKQLNEVASKYSKKISKLEETNKTLQGKNKKYLSQLREAKELLEQYNLEVEKLQHMNDVLRNASLNERQKNKVVDAISNANTLSEVERVFELQESVSSGPTKSEKEKNSLRNLLGRRNEATAQIRSMRKPLKESTDVEGEFKKERWQKLAGIKTNNED